MDRLTTLVERFHLTVTAAPLEQSNLIAKASEAGGPESILFYTQGSCPQSCAGEVLFSARVAWSGQTNPLMAALPDVVEMSLAEHADTLALVVLFLTHMNWQQQRVQRSSALFVSFGEERVGPKF